MDAHFLELLLKRIHDNRLTDDQGNPIDPPTYGNGNSVDNPVKIVLGLNNGNVIRGHVVSAERWLEINTFGNTAPKRIDGDEQQVEGSWPAELGYSPDDAERFSTIYLTMVEFLSGDRWVSGCSVGVKTDKVTYSGDQYL